MHMGSDLDELLSSGKTVRQRLELLELLLLVQEDGVPDLRVEADEHGERILAVDADVAQIWGRLRVPHPENALDKQIAATALIHDLTLVTRNVRHFTATGVRLHNPFV